MGIWAKIENKAKKILENTKVGRELNAGNQMKEDLEQGKYEGLPNQPHADNYAHRYADAKIGQQGKAAATAGFAIGVGKELVDITHKILRGDNIKETLKDSYKDMKNNLDGLKWGLQHPNQDPHEWLAELDLDSNTFKEGYNNGIGEVMKRDRRNADSYMAAKEKQLKDRQTAKAEVRTAGNTDTMLLAQAKMNKTAER